MSEQVIKKYKKIIIGEAIAIAVLIILLIISFFNTRTIVINNDKVSTEKLRLQSELDSLVGQHNLIKNSYGVLQDSLTQKDSLIIANAKEIQKLLAVEYDYYKIKKKLNLLRNITQNYVKQIDSLYKVNETLTTENKAIKKDLYVEKNKNVELSKDNTVLSEKVSQAAMLKAYNVVSEGVKVKYGGKKEEKADKARKVDKVKVCFTLSENNVAQAGTHTIYIRIARPDNLIITKGKDEIYTFLSQGQTLQYSMKKEINYENKQMDICLYWEKVDKEKEAMKGVYHVSVFCDNYEIGQSQFELK